MSTATSLGAVAIGTCGVSSWLLGMEILRCVSPDAGGISFDAALALLFIGVATLILRSPAVVSVRRIIVDSAAGLTIALAGLAVLDYWLSAAGPAASFLPYRRMTIGVVVTATLCAGAVLSLNRQSPRGTRAAQILGVGAAILSFVVILGHAHSLSTWAGAVGDLRPMALPSAVGFALASIAIALARPEESTIRVLVSDGPGGFMARRLLPMAIALPVLLDVVERAGVGRRVVDAHNAAALGTVALTALLIATVLYLADRLDDSEHATNVALEQLAERGEALSRSLQRLALHVEQTPLAVIEWDTNFRAVAWNPAAIRLFGYTEAEALGRHAAELILPSRVRPQLDDLWRQLLQRRGGERSTNENVTKDGRTISCEWYNTPLVEPDGTVVGVASLAQDITERAETRKQLTILVEELRRSNTELEHFAYVASHDLQEPLRMIASYTELLRERYRGKLDADADEFIDFAVDGARRMQRLISDLLTYSRVGQRGNPFESLDTGAVVDQALAHLQLAIRDTHAEVTRDSLPRVTGDPVQLLLLFQNLLGNAIKFHGEAPPRVHVSAERRQHEWVFAIRDNGIGIDPQYADRIFVIFQRLHGPGTYAGTGIGLAICKKVIERHNGRIWVESREGRGATFFFTLPAESES